MPSAYDCHRAAYQRGTFQRLGKFLFGMQRGDNRTHSAFISRHSGIHDTLCKHPFFEETITELHRQSALAHYYRRNWRLAVSCFEPELLQTSFEEVGILP